MHGLVNRSIQCFIRDTYGMDTWQAVVQAAELGFDNFEAMLSYEDSVTHQVIFAAAKILDKPAHTMLEDIGTYLICHKNVGYLRRLLRFGGDTFLEFLLSVDELPDRARLAVPELKLPALELSEVSAGAFSLVMAAEPLGFGHVAMGILRAMADDYGALVYLEYAGLKHGNEIVSVQLLESSFAEGRTFDLALGV
jgi:heme-NO-binding protein